MNTLIVSGIVIGSVYCLVAAGYALVYRTTGILNLVQGSFVMLSGMICSWCITAKHLSYPLAALIGLVGTMLVGLACWVFVLSPMLIRRIYFGTVLATLVMSQLIGNGVTKWQGPNPVFTPNIQPYFTFKFLGTTINSDQLYVVLGMIVLLLGLGSFMRYTSLGRATRACAANREVAQLMGIKPIQVGGIAMVICAFMGGAAGLLLAPLLPDSASGGTAITLYGFVAAVIGGFGRFGGGLVGGILLGILQEFVARYISALYSDAIVFTILILMLVFRPEGIFGEFNSTKQRGRSARRRQISTSPAEARRPTNEGTGAVPGAVPAR